MDKGKKRRKIGTPTPCGAPIKGRWAAHQCSIGLLHPLFLYHQNQWKDDSSYAECSCEWKTEDGLLQHRSVQQVENFLRGRLFPQRVSQRLLQRLMLQALLTPDVWPQQPRAHVQIYYLLLFIYYCLFLTALFTWSQASQMHIISLIQIRCSRRRQILPPVPSPGKLHKTYASSMILAHSLHDATIKPKVHNVLYCCQRRNEPWPQVTCTENLVKSGRVVFETCEQTYIHTYMLIAILCALTRGKVKINLNTTYQLQR